MTVTVQTGGRLRHAVAGRGGSAAGGARGAAHEARHGRLLDIAARIGFAGRGLVYVLIGVLAVQVALGQSNARTNRSGALGEIRDKPFGSVVLAILVVGFLGYALWRLLDAAVGSQGESNQAKRTGKRLVSAGRGVVYLAIAGSTINFLVSGGGGSGEPAPWTARVMRNDAGRFLVGAVGLVVVGIGIGMIIRGLKRKFEEKLKTGEMGAFSRKIAKPAGMVGYAVRGIVFGLAGVFVTKAAIEFDPKEAKGLDGTLKTLAGQAYGQWLLTLCAVGLALFGVYSFFEARYRRL
jgi:hypothetical protein